MTNPNHKEHLPLIQKVRERIKGSDVIQNMCKEYEVDADYLDLIPMCFADISVSARTDKGCIYFNIKLLEDGGFEKDDHYMVHEIRHHFQQCFSDGPTEAPTKDNYLDNECEQEGFRDQTEYLSETRNDQAAEKYIDKVLQHHEVPFNERKKRREELLQLAQAINNKLAADFSPDVAPMYNVGDKVRRRDGLGVPSGPILTITGAMWDEQYEEYIYEYSNGVSLKSAPGDDSFTLIERAGGFTHN